MPGFLVSALAPPGHSALHGVPQTVMLKANIMMMCGCPITPDGTRIKHELVKVESSPPDIEPIVGDKPDKQFLVRLKDTQLGMPPHQLAGNSEPDLHDAFAFLAETQAIVP